MVQSLPGRSGTTAPPGPDDREGPATLVDGEEEMSRWSVRRRHPDRRAVRGASTMATCTTPAADRGPIKRARSRADHLILNAVDEVAADRERRPYRRDCAHSSRHAPVTQRHADDRHGRGVGLGPAPVGLVCLRPRVAGPGSCRGSIQRWNGRIMLELAHDMRHERTVNDRRHDRRRRNALAESSQRCPPGWLGNGSKPPRR